MGNTSEVTLRFKGENAQLLAVINATRGAITGLNGSVGTEFGRIQSRSKSTFTSIVSDLTVFTSRVPVASGVVQSLAGEVSRLDQIGQRAGRSFSGMIGPAAVVAVGAAISVTAGLTKQLFDLLEASSKLGGEIFDLTQKTGLSAERYTALKFATEQAGGSVEKINTGIKNFALLIADANKGTDQAVNRLKRLGVEPKQGIFDLDAALNKALGTIAKAPDGIVQMTLAADAFGKKVGPDLVPTIVSFDGNLEKLTDTARRLGVTLTDLEAEQLDNFGDALDTLKIQGALLAAQFSAQVAPEITAAMQRISARASENKSIVEDWGKATADAFRGVRVAAESDLGQIVFLLAAVTAHMNLFFLAAKGIQQLGAGSRATDPREDPFGPGGALRGGRKNLPGTPEHKAEQKRRAEIEAFQRQLEEEKSKSRGGGGARKSATDTELQKAKQEAALIEREERERIEKDISENKRALEGQARDLEEFTRRAIDLADERLNATIDRINAEQAAIETALSKRKITQEEFNRRDRELTTQTSEAVRRNNDETFELEQERDRKKSEMEVAASQRSLQIEEEARQRIIERIERRISKNVLLETEGARQIADIVDESFKRRIETLQAEESALATSVERRAAINDEIVRLEGERAAASEQAANRIADAIEAEIQTERRFADELREVKRTVKSIELETAAEVLRAMQEGFASRRAIIRARRDLEIAEEEERHRTAAESINRQKQELDREIELLQKRIESLRIGTFEEIEQHERLIRSLEALRQKREELNRQQQAEDIFSQTRKRRVTTGADTDEQDNFAPLQDAFDSLGKTVADVFGASELAGKQFGAIMGGVFNQVAQGIGSLVENYVLLGSTGPAALRKLLAASLAKLAGESAVQAIYWTAMGIADLFFNPARAANDFAAAALFASIAGVSALAGRALAGDLFQQKPAAGGSSGNGASASGTSRSAEPATLNLDRAEHQTAFRQRVDIFVHSEPGRGFNDEVVRALIHDVRLNGESVGVISAVANGGPVR